MAILDGKVNVIRVKDKNGNLGQDRPIGALAENIAFGGVTSNESVEQKINDLISSFDNLSTDKIKKEDKSLTEFLEEVITTSNKADAALRQYLGVTGVDTNGNLLPSQSDGKTILSRLNALEEAIKLNTTIN